MNSIPEGWKRVPVEPPTDKESLTVEPVAYLRKSDLRRLHSKLSVGGAFLGEINAQPRDDLVAVYASPQADHIADASKMAEPVAWLLTGEGRDRVPRRYVLFDETTARRHKRGNYSSGEWLWCKIQPLYSNQTSTDVSALVGSAEAALGEIEDIMQEAYSSAYPVCCGRPGSECCGSPAPEWEEADQRMMDRLAPHQKALGITLAAYRQGGGE